MAWVIICSDFGVQEDKVSHCFHCFPIYLPWSNGTRYRDLSFLNLVLSQLFHSSFPLIKWLSSSSSLSAIRMVSSAYLRLLIFLPAILIPACASSSPAFHMMYSAYKLNKWGDNIQLWITPFPIWDQSVVPCPVLTVWFLTCIQNSQETGKVLLYSHLFKSFPQFVVIHIVKGFGILNKTEVDIFLELLIFWWSNRCWQFDLWSLCLF